MTATKVLNKLKKDGVIIAWKKRPNRGIYALYLFPDFSVLADSAFLRAADYELFVQALNAQKRNLTRKRTEKEIS